MFGLDQFTVLFGDTLAQYPTVLMVLGRVWLGLLVSSVLLVLLTGRARGLYVALFVAMHGGMLLTMRLGLFPLVSIAALLPFLPGRVWDTMTARLSALGLALHPGRWRTRLERLLPIGRSAARVSGLDLASGSDKASDSDRVSGSDRASDPDLASGSDRASDTDRASGILPAVPPGLRRVKHRGTPVVVAALLAVALLWNAASLGYVDLPDGINSVADPAEHRWDVFAPSPPRTDAWYVVPGTLESGARIDAFHRSPVQWDRPPDVTRMYPTARWRKYLIDLWWADDDALTSHLAAYLCRRWNTRHQDDLVELTVYVVRQPTRLDGPEPTERVELLQYACSADATPGRVGIDRPQH